MSKEKYKPWDDFRKKYGHFMYKSGYESDEIAIMNDVFKKLNEQPIAGVHKAMAYCTYVTLRLCSRRMYILSNADIKQLWGYSKDTKEINSAFRALDSMGFTKTVKKGYKQIEYGDNPKGNFYRIDSQIMFGFIFKNKVLGAVAFYIYSYIVLAVQLNRGNPQKISISYFSKGLGLDEGTIKKYLKLLQEYGFIVITSGTSVKLKDEFEDFIGYDMNTYEVLKELSSKIMFDENISVNTANLKATDATHVEPTSFDYNKSNRYILDMGDYVFKESNGW